MMFSATAFGPGIFMLLHMLGRRLHVLGLNMLRLYMLLLHVLLRLLRWHMLLLLNVLLLNMLLLNVLLLLAMELIPSGVAAIDGGRMVLRRRMIYRTGIRDLRMGMKGGTIYPVHRQVGRAAMVHRGELVTIPACRLFMGGLRGGPLNMIFMHDRLFLGVGAHRDAARAVEAGSVRGGMNHRAIDVCIMDHRSVDIHHGGVIPEMPSGPYSSSKSGASVSITIIYASVVAYMGTPVPNMPSIKSAIIAPIPWGPKESHLGRTYPHSGNPIIPIVPVGPITGRPQIPVVRAGWLGIDRQRGRPDPYGNPYAYLCFGAYRGKR
jgi:hypothetical protein